MLNYIWVSDSATQKYFDGGQEKVDASKIGIALSIFITSLHPPWCVGLSYDWGDRFPALINIPVNYFKHAI